MSTGGWIIMILSVGSVTTLFAWCVYKVLFGKPLRPEDYRAEAQTEARAPERK
jgi:hypothetical protein